jgi:polysaccharide export outer membrane protein
MKLTAHSFFALGMICSALVFTGCRSSQPETFFSDPSPVYSPSVNYSASPNNHPSTQANPLTNNSKAGKNIPPEVALFHVGDTVTVIFSGLPINLDPHTEPIKEDGTITLPDIGPVQAAGKTAGQLQSEIHDQYVPRLYRHLTVTVSTGDRVYYVRGEVKGAGRQLYVGETTVTRALASAGDFTDFANHKNVLLIRANGQQIKVNCDKVMDGKEQDPAVYPGDQIVVKRRIF